MKTMAMNISKIESEIASLRKVKALSTDDALSQVHEIVKMMGKDIEEQIENENFEALMELYEKAAEVYLLAAEKVPREKWGVLASPSSFWEMRAEQTRSKLKLEKSLASRHRIAPISKPLQFVGIDTITPSLKTKIHISKPIHEIGLQYPKKERYGDDTITPSLKTKIHISKPIHEIGLQYPKKERYGDVQPSFMKAITDKFTEKYESMNDDFMVYGYLGQSKKNEDELKVEHPPLFHSPTAPEIELKDVTPSQYAVINVPLKVKSNIGPLSKPV